MSYGTCHRARLYATSSTMSGANPSTNERALRGPPSSQAQTKKGTTARTAGDRVSAAPAKHNPTIHMRRLPYHSAKPKSKNITQTTCANIHTLGLTVHHQ